MKGSGRGSGAVWVRDGPSAGVWLVTTSSTALASLKWAGEPCEPFTRPGTVLLRSPVSCWQEGETTNAWPLPSSTYKEKLGWFFIDWVSMGFPPQWSGEYPVRITHVSSHLMESQKTFWPKERKRRPLPEIFVPLSNGPGGSGTNVAQLPWPGGSPVWLPVGYSDWGGANCLKHKPLQFKGDLSYIRVHAIWTSPLLVFKGIH